MSKGMRPLTDSEISQVIQTFSGKFANRDRALFLLGIKAGFRISELLSLTVNDVYQNGRILDRVYVRRQNMKGKNAGRCVILHSEAKSALVSWITELMITSPEPATFLFKSRVGHNRAISRVQAWKMLESIFARAGLSGVLGTHSLRKTFADRVYEKLGHDLLKTQKALAHRSINSTLSYLSFKEEQIDEAILSI